MGSSAADYKKSLKELSGLAGNDKFIKLADEFHATKSETKRAAIIKKLKVFVPGHINLDSIRPNCIRICFINPITHKRMCFYYCRPYDTRLPN